MNWREAEINLRENIRCNDHLDGFDHYKIVTEVPNADRDVFTIKVGKSSYINVTLLMLQTIFEESLINNRTYNRTVFKNSYPIECDNKPCYVHAIGKLLVHAGIAIVINNRSYRIQ